MELDEIDRAIIETLQMDARLSNTALADRIGLTPAPCLRRVKQLEEVGVIRGYHADVNPEALGQGFEVFLDIEMTDFARGVIDSFEETMCGYSEVLELHRLFGTPDYHARVATADASEYELFLIDRVLTIPGIARVSSRFAMKTLKSLRPAGSDSALQKLHQPKHNAETSQARKATRTRRTRH